MKCTRCNRPLRTFTAMIGGYPFGPTCAARMGLATTKQKHTRKVKQVRSEIIYAEQFELEFGWMP